MGSSPSDNATGLKSRRMTVLLAVAAGALVVSIFVVLLGTLIWLFGYSIPDDRERAAAAKTHAAFELALEEVRVRDAYALTSARFQQETSFDGFRELIDQHPIVIGRPGTHWTKDGWAAHKSGPHEFTHHTVVTSDGHVVSFTCVFVVERGQARVDSLTFR
jgi:hypothetical protein